MITVFTYISLNKQKIIKQVTAELSKRINGQVTIGNVELSFLKNFPKVSVLLHDIKVTDSMYAQHHHPFLEAKEVFALLSIKKLVKKQSPLNGIRIDHGTVYIFTDTTGYTNGYLLKQKKDPEQTTKPSNKKSALQYIKLNDFRIVIDDKKKEKLHDLLVNKIDAELDDKDDQSFLFAIDADILVHSMAFNLGRGSYLKEKKFKADFDMRFDKRLQQLQLDSIEVRLENHAFNMTARFDLSGVSPQFNLRLHTRNIVYDKVKSLLPERIARSISLVEVNNPVDASASVTGPLKGGDPLVYITWSSKESRIMSPFLDFDEAAFTGYFTNEVVPGMPRKDPNSKIVLNNFSANWHGLPVHSNNIEVLDLSDPVISCDLQSSFELTRLNEIIGTNSLQFSSGEAVVDMTYKGPLQKNDNANSFINGSVTFKNGTAMYVPRNVELQQLNAKMLFRNSDVFIDSLQTTVLNNRFMMNVAAKNLLTLINTGPNNINIDWNIYSPLLNLNSFTYLLQSRKKVSKTNNNKKVIAKAASTIDEILDQGKLNVQLKTDKIIYRKFEAQNVLANLLLLSDRYIINNASMNHAGGKLNMDGSLQPGQQYNTAKLNMSMNNVDVHRLFKAFENFGQDGITEQNLEGQLTAKATASFQLDQNGKVKSESIVSAVDFSLKNGMLNKFEPIKKLQRLVFKKRDFDSIRFAELKNRLDIAEREIKINRMEIQSSVMSMFVEGIYSQKGNTDISIQVPLSNLKKRDSTYIPENAGVDKKGGKSIFLRGRPGPDGNIKFNIDLFKKYEKAKKNR